MQCKYNKDSNATSTATSYSKTTVSPPSLQGSARVIRCLTNSRDKLSPVCRATLFDEEVRFSENIDFQYPMKTACVREISQYCKDIPHGNAKVIRCAGNTSLTRVPVHRMHDSDLGCLWRCNWFTFDFCRAPDHALFKSAQ